MKTIKQTIKELNIPTTLYLVLSPFFATGVLIYFTIYDLWRWETVVLAVFMWVASGMSITVGYHRHFSHRSYKTKKWIEYLYILFGSSALEMSVVEWAFDHRNHHRYTDTEKDPYSIKKGFWYAHILWLFSKRGVEPGKPEIDFKKVGDLWKDPFIRFQHKYFIPMAIFMGFLFPGLIALLWNDFWGGVLIAGLVRSVIVHHGTFAINSVCHAIGKQPYSLSETARDSWISALLTFGEGYHNFHHKFPGDYRNAILPWQYDPSKWFIWILSKLGLAWDLHITPEERIYQAKLEVIEQKIKNLSESNLVEKIKEKKQQVEAIIQQILSHKDQAIENSKKIIAQKRKELKQKFQDLEKEFNHYFYKKLQFQN
ncbi:MAG: fatty acid desaturase [Leptospiraceae bacterium]|nr:fatty acid desaturase [Leptospiraceae bacterium]